MAHVFFCSVREGAAPKYSEEQRRAWCPSEPDPETFAKRLDGLTSFVAVRAGKIVGFMSLRGDGYLDFAFVMPAERGRGVADHLWAMVLNEALVEGMDNLSTQASTLARSFFARHGWVHEGAQEIERAGVILENHLM